jgi:hypothetical protein
MANKITGSFVKKFTRTNTLLQSIVRTINSLIDEEVIEVTGSLTHAQILTLGSAPVELVADAAVRASEYIYPLDLLIKYTYGGVAAYGVVAPLYIYYNGSATNFIAASGNILDGTVSAIYFSKASASPNYPTTTLLAGTGVRLSTSSLQTPNAGNAGNSLDYVFRYKIITI